MQLVYCKENTAVYICLVSSHTRLSVQYRGPKHACTHAMHVHIRIVNKMMSGHSIHDQCTNTSTMSLTSKLLAMAFAQINVAIISGSYFLKYNYLCYYIHCILYVYYQVATYAFQWTFLCQLQATGKCISCRPQASVLAAGHKQACQLQATSKRAS